MRRSPLPPPPQRHPLRCHGQESWIVPSPKTTNTHPSGNGLLPLPLFVNHYTFPHPHIRTFVENAVGGLAVGGILEKPSKNRQLEHFRLPPFRLLKYHYCKTKFRLWILDFLLLCFETQWIVWVCLKSKVQKWICKRENKIRLSAFGLSIDAPEYQEYAPLRPKAEGRIYLCTSLAMTFPKKGWLFL